MGSNTRRKLVTYTGENPKIEIEGLGWFTQGVARPCEVTEEQARSLAGKGFLVEDPAPTRKER